VRRPSAPPPDFAARPRNTGSIAPLDQARALENAGRLDEALSMYKNLLRYADAARVAEALGRQDIAAQHYLDAGQAFDAARAFAASGDTRSFFDALVRVPRDDLHYREAAIQAIDMASSLNLLDFRLEQFLTRFVATAPESERELESLYLLGRIYLRHDFPENAAEAFRKIVNLNPGYRDAAQQLDALANELRGSARVFEQIVREEASFHHGDPLARAGARRGPVDLPGLPELPSLSGIPLPDLPSAPGAMPGAASPTLAQAVRPRSSVPPPRIPDRTIADLPPGRGTPAWVDPSLVPPPLPPVRSSVPPPPGLLTSASLSVPPPKAPTPMSERPPMAVPPARANPPPRPTMAPPPPAPAPAPTTPRAFEFSEGAIFAERYKIQKRIGRGGMSSVFKATDLELGVDIAIKVFTQPIEEDAEQLRRFKQELVLSRQLTHANIVRLFDIGAHQGYRYITMELLTGHDLKALLGKPMVPARGIPILLQACAGLQIAHDQGIIHRDVKSANFFITKGDQLKIMDFGIAKSTGGGGHTVAGTIAGTPNYMSPEQINGFEKVTYSTDIYAMGVIAYEMFTGRVPFSHPEMMQILMMHLREKPVPPRIINPTIPERLEQAILRLLEKTPGARFPSCKALAQELEFIQQQLPK
jgi:serine/threonine-protein kinase